MNPYRLHPRRRMFEDMGHADRAALEAMLAGSTPLLRRGLADGMRVEL